MSRSRKYSKAVINGEFCARRLTGQERVARELTLELDKLVADNPIPLELVVPEYAESVPMLANIPIIKYGKFKGSFWEQASLAHYAFKNNAYCLNICSVAPLLSHGSIFIHDICYKEKPEYFRSVYARVSRLWHKINFWYAWHRAERVYTVSNYSKDRMVETYGVNPSRITVVYPGWRYYDNVDPDRKVEKVSSSIRRGDYYYTLGSLAPNKNLDWVVGVAKRNPNSTFIVAGGFNATAYGCMLSGGLPNNMHCIGYVTDAESKYLMIHCKAFIFPSEYEGFGIPPLEALSVGTQVVASNVTCLPEIYEDAVHYVDPKDTNVDLDALLSEPVADPAAVLAKCDYAKMAQTVMSELRTKVYYQ